MMIAKSRERIIPVKSDSNRKQAEKLLELLFVFGRHRRFCHWNTLGSASCTCDWGEVKSALEEL